MILFRREHVASILDDSKHQTRRLWKKCRVKVGSIHQARTRMLDKDSTFARLRILRAWREWLMAISPSDALAEGYETPAAYCEAFWRINHLQPGTNVRLWCVEFRLEISHD